MDLTRLQGDDLLAREMEDPDVLAYLVMEALTLRQGAGSQIQQLAEYLAERPALPERVPWARLSVFVGGFELDAVEGVCADGCLRPEDVVDVLAGLVDRSVVDRVDVGQDSGGQARYLMLETIREFGQDT